MFDNKKSLNYGLHTNYDVHEGEVSRKPVRTEMHVNMAIHATSLDVKMKYKKKFRQAQK